MPDDSRIEELRGRIRKDPASIAFAQLAEELRQAKRYTEAIAVCRTGLVLYPAYLSARVTLGRCLIALDQLGEAQRELEQVRDGAPDNLAAVRALADIQSRLTPKTNEDAQKPEVRLPRSADAFAKAEALREGGKPDATYNSATYTSAEDDRAVRTVAALDAWLAAIHVTRANRSA
jgi:predicted Zn-dependent protease